MSTPRFLDEIGAKLSELAANSPVRDFEKNAKAMLGGAFSKLDLVTRDEFEISARYSPTPARSWSSSRRGSPNSKPASRRATRPESRFRIAVTRWRCE